jgi:hypothetical protein
MSSIRPISECRCPPLLARLHGVEYLCLFCSLIGLGGTVAKAVRRAKHPASLTQDHVGVPVHLRQQVKKRYCQLKYAFKKGLLKLLRDLTKASSILYQSTRAKSSFEQLLLKGQCHEIFYFWFFS